MSDSWQSFVSTLSAEAALLAAVGECALTLTEALVQNDPDAIERAERKLDYHRREHFNALEERMAMQRRGFGDLRLAAIAQYAPPPIRLQLDGCIADLRSRAVSLSLTNQNNRVLIAAGMDRLRKTVSILQHSAAEKPGTYKRRGIVPPTDASVLVSQRA